MKPGRLNKALLLVAPCLGLAACGDSDPPAAPEQPPLEVEASEQIVDNSNIPGVTPMGERVAIVALLNKRNGLTRDLEMSPGQQVRVGNALVLLRACETTAPWEDQAWTGAFVQLDVAARGTGRMERVFSGWLYRESPSLNLVEHPVYDVWVKSCTMSFPGGPDGEVSAPPTSESSRPNAGASAPEAAPAASPDPAPEPPAESADESI